MKRKVAKGKEQRKADCSSKTPTEPPKKDNIVRDAVVGHVQGKVVSGMMKQGVVSKLKGVKKQDLTAEF